MLQENWASYIYMCLEGKMHTTGKDKDGGGRSSTHSITLGKTTTAGTGQWAGHYIQCPIWVQGLKDLGHLPLPSHAQ